MRPLLVMLYLGIILVNAISVGISELIEVSRVLYRCAIEWLKWSTRQSGITEMIWTCRTSLTLDKKRFLGSYFSWSYMLCVLVLFWRWNSPVWISLPAVVVFLSWTGHRTSTLTAQRRTWAESAVPCPTPAASSLKTRWREDLMISRLWLEREILLIPMCSCACLVTASYKHYVWTWHAEAGDDEGRRFHSHQWLHW